MSRSPFSIAQDHAALLKRGRDGVHRTDTHNPQVMFSPFRDVAPFVRSMVGALFHSASLVSLVAWGARPYQTEANKSQSKMKSSYAEAIAGLRFFANWLALSFFDKTFTRRACSFCSAVHCGFRICSRTSSVPSLDNGGVGFKYMRFLGSPEPLCFVQRNCTTCKSLYTLIMPQKTQRASDMFAQVRKTDFKLIHLGKRLPSQAAKRTNVNVA